MCLMVAFQNVLLTHKYTKYQWPHRSCHSRARTFAYPQGYYLLQCKSYWPHQRETPFQFLCLFLIELFFVVELQFFVYPGHWSLTRDLTCQCFLPSQAASGPVDRFLRCSVDCWHHPIWQSLLLLSQSFLLIFPGWLQPGCRVQERQPERNSPILPTF